MVRPAGKMLGVLTTCNKTHRRMNRSLYRTRLPRFSSNALLPFRNGRIAETTELLVLNPEKRMNESVAVSSFSHSATAKITRRYGDLEWHRRGSVPRSTLYLT